jgi:putative tryptophan/tyrosine transport system substrate-binding protein
MKRREFIAGIGGAAAWPVVARGQQAAVPKVGFLSVRREPGEPHLMAAFRQGLHEGGYVEGRNVEILYRWAEGRSDRLPPLAADLVRRQVAVIATPDSTPATLAAKAATQTIPIVFDVGGDPVELGLVQSLNRPGGNLTGITTLSAEAASKPFELLHELVPASDLFAVLVNPTNRTIALEAQGLQVAAQVLGVRLLILDASSEGDIEKAFATIVRERAGALVISSDNLFLTQRDQIVALAARYAVPATQQYREFTAAGGLMSYGSSLTEMNRQVGVYTGRILNGEKPADLPVHRATKIEFVINLKTAQHLFGVVLADYIIVENLADFLRRRDAVSRFTQRGLGLLAEDILAQLNAFIADEHCRAGDELADLMLALAAERAIERSLRIAACGLARSSLPLILAVSISHRP